MKEHAAASEHLESMIQDIKPSLPSFMRIPNGLLDGQRKKEISTASAFTPRIVDIETLADMTRDDFKGMGITVGKASKIMRAVKKLQAVKQ